MPRLRTRIELRLSRDAGEGEARTKLKRNAEGRGGSAEDAEEQRPRWFPRSVGARCARYSASQAGGIDTSNIVIPAAFDELRSGNSGAAGTYPPWVPAFAGMTAKERFHVNGMRFNGTIWLSFPFDVALSDLASGRAAGERRRPRPDRRRSVVRP